MIGYFILGIRRSGNHMFINFLLENYNKILYYNNIDTNILNNHLIKTNSTIIGDINLSQKLVNNINENPECIIFSFEDISITAFQNYTIKIKKLFPLTEIKSIIILRDLLNCISSRLKRNNNIIAPVNERIINLWKEHFYTNNYIKIYYNLFISSESYRQSIGNILNLNYINEVNSIPQFFSGSSFETDVTIKQPIANYLTRYQEFLDNNLIKELLQQKNLIYDIEYIFNIHYNINNV